MVLATQARSPLPCGLASQARSPAGRVILHVGAMCALRCISRRWRTCFAAVGSIRRRLNYWSGSGSAAGYQCICMGCWSLSSPALGVCSTSFGVPTVIALPLAPLPGSSNLPNRYDWQDPVSLPGGCKRQQATSLVLTWSPCTRCAVDLFMLFISDLI